jgi:hypothetical protein
MLLTCFKKSQLLKELLTIVGTVAKTFCWSTAVAMSRHSLKKGKLKVMEIFKIKETYL